LKASPFKNTSRQCKNLLGDEKLAAHFPFMENGTNADGQLYLQKNANFSSI
jgi:hypothetical protein